MGEQIRFGGAWSVVSCAFHLGSCILLILVVIAWMIGLPKGSTVEAILPAVGLLTTLTAGVTAYYFGKER